MLTNVPSPQWRKRRNFSRKKICVFHGRNSSRIPSGNQTWQWKIECKWRFQWWQLSSIIHNESWIFQCHVWLPEGTLVFRRMWVYGNNVINYPWLGRVNIPAYPSYLWWWLGDGLLLCYARYTPHSPGFQKMWFVKRFLGLSMLFPLRSSLSWWNCDTATQWCNRQRWWCRSAPIEVATC